MSVIDLGLMVIVTASLLGAVCGALLPPRTRPHAVGVLTAVAGAGGVLAGASALAGGTTAFTVPGLVPLSQATLSVDALSGVFLLLTGVVGAAAGVYAIGYTGVGHAPGHSAGPVHSAGSGASSRTAQATLPLFVGSMLLVPAASGVTTFLLLWEAMALTSLVLVLSDHRSREGVRQSGIWYAAMTHAGFVGVLLALVILAAAGEGETFSALRDGAAHLSGPAATAVFLLALAGFGSKAGMVPLHVWLPRAHPEAPSHVSALMSAAMVKLGVYGLVRVWFDLLGGGPGWWGLLALALGALSALYGVLQASVSEDLKSLLAYSTTENIGLMLMGVGAAGMFAAQGSRTLAGLLMAAALLHGVNHAAFKSLLFLGAGSVLRSTGLRGLDSLGGLARRMPVTTALFGVGALCAAALPPGNGFVSEWLLLQGLIHSFTGAEATGVVAVTMPLAVGVVALTAGLGVMTFVKAFGTGFLARPRSEPAASATESPRSMRAGMGLAALACVALAALPTAAAQPSGRVLQLLPTVRNSPPIGGDAVTLRLSGIAGSMSPLVIGLSVVVACLGGWALTRRWRRVSMPRPTPLWNCGGQPLTSRMEYTATSFAEPLTRVFEDVLRPEQDVEVTHLAPSGYLIGSMSFRQHVSDRIEARLYPPLLAAVRAVADTVRRLQDGSVHRYLAYGLVGVLALLLAVGVTS
jgi:formate hydrogenlyase subunit 3/multisubunit Na+/H+ antiporter MnhD subunit